MNSSVTTISKQNTSYSYYGEFVPIDQNSTDEEGPDFLPIEITLYAYRGYGKFSVEYC